MGLLASKKIGGSNGAVNADYKRFMVKLGAKRSRTG
jgi:hypothetical protein